MNSTNEAGSPDRTTLLAAVARVLTERYGSSVVLGEVEQISEEGRRNLLLRCALIEGADDLPRSLVVKQVKGNYDPEKLDSWDTRRFFQDWAGAGFLSALSPNADHGPRFYGADRALGFVILEDMGRSHRSLVEPLLEEDAASAERALFQFVTRLGRMHAESLGRSAQYEQLAAAIHPQAATAILDTERLVTELKRLRAELEEHISLDAGFETELLTAMLSVVQPGPFYTFTHGDPCPDNIFYNGESLRLIDFELGRLNSALLDAVYGRMTFPTCWCANRLPEDLVVRLETAYREQLVQTCPAAQDDRLFEQALVDGCAFWLFAIMTWLFSGALAQDDRWGISSVRSRFLTRLEIFITTSAQFNHRPVLRSTANRLLEYLRTRWPETEPLPFYPAFGS